MPATGGGANAVISVVDSDASVRNALCRLAISAGFDALPFESIEQFIAPAWPDDEACVILDASQLPAGSVLRETMRRRGVDWPVIVLCAADGQAARHGARNVGARFLLKKPVDAQALLDAIAWVTEGNG